MNTPFPVRTDGKFTVEEYLAFIEARPEEERWQLIDGVAMMMPPPTVPHQIIAGNLAFELNTHFRQQRRKLLAVQEIGSDGTQRGQLSPEGRYGRRRQAV